MFNAPVIIPFLSLGRFVSACVLEVDNEGICTFGALPKEAEDSFAGRIL